MSTMMNDQANAYLRTQVMGATAEELRLMLLDGAVKFTRQGRDGLEKGDLERSFEGFAQARAIITELMTSMRTDVAPELCERVRSLYTFMYTELVSASMERDIAKADTVIELLGFERETWVMLMEQLKVERAGGEPASPAGTQAATPAQHAEAPGGYRPLSLEG